MRQKMEQKPLDNTQQRQCQEHKRQSTWAHAEPAGSEGRGRTAANTSICRANKVHIKYQNERKSKTEILTLSAPIDEMTLPCVGLLNSFRDIETHACIQMLTTTNPLLSTNSNIKTKSPKFNDT
jgi:hypothetical protein